MNNIYNQIINEKNSFTQVDNFLIEEIMPTLSKREIVIFLIILRYTEGFHRAKFTTSPKQLSERSNIHAPHIPPVLKSLQDKGYIRIEKVNKNSLEIIYDRAKVKENMLDK